MVSRQIVLQSVELEQYIMEYLDMLYQANVVDTLIPSFTDLGPMENPQT